ncbi:RepB family plasmid replication initiator protein [Staphylococcus epidermidis]|nr:RepB family plasmid replication initiator protein [Staphylococcus epidermidis]
MSGETVVYRNEMNLVSLRRFTSTEVDLFFTLCNKLKEQDTRKVIIPFEELKYLSNYYTRSQERFINDLEHVYDKMLNLTYVERNGRSFEKFVLFTSYKVDLDEECLSISVNLDLKHILNSITADFKNRLDIPKTYQMNDITKRVLKPIINELSSIFNNLNINKIKAKKGRKIEWLEFTFDAEKRIHNKRQPQMTNVGKQRQYISREKTPRWLEERTCEKN